MKTIQLEPRHLKIVKDILTNYPFKVLVFGSRAKGTAKNLSDLDLVILDDIDKSTYRKIMDEFEESNLPFKVDLIIWNKIDSNFQNHIKNDLVELE